MDLKKLYGKQFVQSYNRKQVKMLRISFYFLFLVCPFCLTNEILPKIKCSFVDYYHECIDATHDDVNNYFKDQVISFSSSNFLSV